MLGVQCHVLEAKKLGEYVGYKMYAKLNGGNERKKKD